MVIITFCGKTKRIDESISLVNLYSFVRNLFGLQGVGFEIYHEKEPVTQIHLDNNAALRVVADATTLSMLEKNSYDLEEMKWHFVKEQFTQVRDEMQSLQNQNHNLTSQNRRLEEMILNERNERQSMYQDQNSTTQDADLQLTMKIEQIQETSKYYFDEIQKNLK